MADMKQYVQDTLDLIGKRDPEQKQFKTTVSKVLETVVPVLEKHPEYKEQKILERMVEPERVVSFRVPWQDDKGVTHINRGFRVQMNSAVGPYKGGLRFHPSVNLDILKFLAFEQVYKNALTGLPIGGAKGGSDFDPHGKSDNEVMHFCQSFMTELYRHIGPHVDVPAGDIGVGGREIGYLFGQYKRICNAYDAAVLTGKRVDYWGSLARPEATGYGLMYFVKNMLDDKNISLKDKTLVVSGAGNVATYAIEKAQEYGAKVVTCSDSDGYIYDPNGIDLDAVKEIKQVRRGRIKEYVAAHPQAEYHEGCTGVWTVKCDVALPCATQGEIDIESAKALVANGVIAVGEGANMPSSLEAIEYFQQNKVLFAPAKAANAGGVAVSALEMSQNSERLQWTFAEVDNKLKDIMANIYRCAKANAEKYADPDDLVAGANITAFVKVADIMLAHGLV
ncbi:NADP-specific glutamate dehydrogenase [Selenomonas caprae]|uniref:Glutamate dehydrogenase n=2 Tax=Selenomonas TaxID=970 RepID=A0A1I3CFI2_SELRU|nr:MULTISPECIES: NADP-specific glutamate dehydrogenase [Selenomonas]TYZ30724.1 NADP-specific glutamate dehydrogenase [Selenomonas caprae]SFH73318.1 glutamate dehydrogenase (NADP+) [Selenomonas ruminantium]